mgnify:CR=1 FL=1
MGDAMSGMTYVRGAWLAVCAKRRAAPDVRVVDWCALLKGARCMSSIDRKEEAKRMYDNIVVKRANGVRLPEKTGARPLTSCVCVCVCGGVEIV